MTAASENEVPNTIKTETEPTAKTETEPTTVKTESTMKTEETETKPKVEDTTQSTKLEPISTEGVEVESREFFFSFLVISSCTCLYVSIEMRDISSCGLY